MTTRSFRWPVALIAVAAPGSAHAHSAVKGLGSFYQGLLHPFLLPAHLLILVGLGLYLGQRPPLPVRLILAWFLPLTVAALTIATLGAVPELSTALLFGIALVIGLLVAAARELPREALYAVTAAGALAVGMDSGLPAGSLTSTLVMGLGNVIGIVGCVLNIAFYASLCKPRWLQIGIRVVGSWIAAVAVLAIAFALRTK